MAIIVRIPQPLRSLTKDAATVDGSGDSLLACIDFLDSQYPGVRERVMDESGEIRRFVNVYINGDDVRFIQGLKSPVKDGDEISIVPAVAGGA
jgi:molybdopterin synthase sulfur carrier subunit